MAVSVSIPFCRKHTTLCSSSKERKKKISTNAIDRISIYYNVNKFQICFRQRNHTLYLQMRSISIINDAFTENFIYPYNANKFCKHSSFVGSVQCFVAPLKRNTDLQVRKIHFMILTLREVFVKDHISMNFKHSLFSGGMKKSTEKNTKNIYCNNGGKPKELTYTYHVCMFYNA